MLSAKMFRCVKPSAMRASLASCRRHEHTLPQLPYSYGALEPAISREIMELHHQKHHATYVANLNAAEKQLRECLDKEDVSCAIGVQTALKFNGGGHINHSIFWNNLSPNGGGDPQGDLLAAIIKDFGSLDGFRNMMTTRTVAIQGSGWGWLGYNRQFKRLEIATCANQDPLQATTGLVPLLGMDVWEHAYYLQYRNVRPNYVKAIWDIINWDDVANRLAAATTE